MIFETRTVLREYGSGLPRAQRAHHHRVCARNSREAVSTIVRRLSAVASRLRRMALSRWMMLDKDSLHRSSKKIDDNYPL
jgi:hypothetical protein